MVGRVKLKKFFRWGKSHQWDRKSPNGHLNTDQVVDPAKIVEKGVPSNPLSSCSRIRVDRDAHPRDTLASWGEDTYRAARHVPWDDI